MKKGDTRMAQERRRFSSEFRKKVALEAPGEGAR